MITMVSFVKIIVSYILPPLAFFVAWQARSDSKRSAIASEKSAEEAKNSRKIALRDLMLPHIIEVEKFLNELDKSGSLQAGELKDIEASVLSLINYEDKFLFLSPVRSLIEKLASNHQGVEASRKIDFSSLQSTKPEVLAQMGLKDIIKKMKIKNEILES